MPGHMKEEIDFLKGSEMELPEELPQVLGPSKNSEKQSGMSEEEREGFPQVGLDLLAPQLIVMLNLQPMPQ